MSSYTGKHAEYYDIIYADKPYAKEASILHDLLTKHSKGQTKRLLELACGTGRHAFELEKLGYEIVATDYSQDLLEVAKRKAKENNSIIDFRLQDMRDLFIADPAFDAVYCLFDSIGYVQTNDALEKMLRNVSKQVRPDGLFIFEFWHAAAMLRNYEPKRERRWKTPKGELARTSLTRLDVPKQLAVVTYEFEEKLADGKSERLTETQVNRYFLVQEMALFLKQASFGPIEWLVAYEPDAQIDENTWHVLAVARSIQMR